MEKTRNIYVQQSIVQCRDRNRQLRVAKDGQTATMLISTVNQAPGLPITNRASNKLRMNVFPTDRGEVGPEIVSIVNSQYSKLRITNNILNKNKKQFLCLSIKIEKFCPFQSKLDTKL